MAEREDGNPNPKVDLIIGQYRHVVGALDVMFREMSKKTLWEIWKQDGVGSCAIPREVSESGIVGLARGALIALRDERNGQNGLQTVEGRSVCPYHRANHGCVLGDLKSPICIAYIENKDEFLEKFGLDAAAFYKEVRSILDRILFAGVDDRRLVCPELNDELVDQFVGRIEDEIERIKTYPIVTTRIFIVPSEVFPDASVSA